MDDLNQENDKEKFVPLRKCVDGDDWEPITDDDPLDFYEDAKGG